MERDIHQGLLCKNGPKICMRRKGNMNNTPELPKGYRLVTDEEKNSVAHLSSYLAVYPRILNECLMWKQEYGWKQGPYRFFWGDAIYCVPIERDKS